MSPEDETIQRWHDRDKSGWWILFNMDQISGPPLALVENGFLRGTKGSNRDGSDLLQSDPDGFTD
jgi:uncharacterized membrane protein YhaH (DUF805 family)